MLLSVYQIDLTLVLHACLPPRSHADLMLVKGSSVLVVSNKVCQKQQPGKLCWQPACLRCFLFCFLQFKSYECFGLWLEGTLAGF